ncbi:ST14 transmembrane serine protease matriptase a [Megalops cyprinoides]|uniref:ST14 transmembrane serine protease matriptase a n=1 Tax=Megalops cyprinoides TaxID=118141 RepID=UPI001864AA7B|nr:ST14 transmembrane serine protease matriptase a [Megalops cyprinoides]
MDPLDSGMRYTPKSQDREWDAAIQFLPASDSSKLEKKKGPGKVGAIIGLVIFAAVIALMTGLLVWHFHFRKDTRIQKMYSGSMRITNQVFVDAYEDPNSTEFKALAMQVVSQLKSIYSRTPELSKCYVRSTVQAFSEGTVIAYYLSEFSVPVGQEAVVDKTILSMDKIVDKQQGRMKNREGNSLLFDNVESRALDARLFRSTFTASYSYYYHARSGEVRTLQSPGFPNDPYAPNTFSQWWLRADPGYAIKLDFDTFNLEEDCRKDFVKVYDSLVAIESRILKEECGHYAYNEHLTFVSSRNVMLVTLVTDETNNYPGFRAHFTQIPRDQVCGGQLTGSKGSFTSPNYPSYYPPQVKCEWNIEVPAGKQVKVQFNKIYMSEPTVSTTCSKDYVEVNGERLCGDKSNVVVTGKTNQMKVMFNSDSNYVDHGFTAQYEAFNPSNPCPDKFQCSNTRCINSDLRCDGWNDCGDNSDEKNCQCSESQIKCRNTMCKPKFWMCDGVNDCGDNTDEDNCGGCKSGEITCRNGRCVSEKKKCDGTDDCGDNTDESECSRVSQVTCTEFTYRCKNNNCINKVNPECDGVVDCEDGSDEAECDCGKQPFKVQRIVGGQNANEGEWPWQVSLHIKGAGHVCGASIINNKWLVTAAHCVQDDNKIKYSQPSVWEAYLGLHIQKQNTKFTVKRNLRRVIAHPYYNHYTFDHDIALMELDSPVTLNEYVMPICLPSPAHEFPAGKSVWITGWGATREGGYGASVLQKAEVRIINSTVCNQLMGGQITSRMVCAGVLAGGVDACQGDSGGPMSSLESDGHMFLAGVVSWGDGCARRNKPGIYTKVTKYRGWIKEQTGV